MGRTPALILATVVLAMSGCGSGVRDDPADSSGPPEATPTASSPGRVAPARRARSAVAAEPPALATLPSGRRVPVRSVGTTATGLLDVPADVNQAGWWSGGSQLGDPFGSTLVAAHVDSRTQGLGPFAELLTVPRGARIHLRSKHLTQTFEVRSRRLVPQGSLVRETWLFDVAGKRRLTLVTCAPPYDASRGGYQYLAVITAVPVFVVERR